jgi:hypothetical protein
MPEQLFRARFQLTHPVGAKVEFDLPAGTAADLVERVDKLVSILIDKGWGVAATGDSSQDTGGAPLCPIHKKPMKPSQHGGWFCPVKIAEDDGSGKPVYCKATA